MEGICLKRVVLDGEKSKIERELITKGKFIKPCGAMKTLGEDEGSARVAGLVVIRLVQVNAALFA